MDSLNQGNNNRFTKTTMASAIAVALGAASSTVSSESLFFDWSGAFTMVEPSGTTTLFNSAPGSQVAPYWGYRTAISGTLTYDLDTGAIAATITPYSFFAGGDVEATTISFQAIGNGFGGEGSLILGNMGFNWSGNNGIPVSIVLDAAGLFGYLDGQDPNATPTDGYTGDTLSGFGATAATDGFIFEEGGRFGTIRTFSLPMGPSPLVTTTWNTSAIGTPAIGDNPSGTLPLIADSIPGSPMLTAPFSGHIANFDIVSMHVTSTGTVPPTAAIVIPGGTLLECAAASGNTVSVNVQVTVPEPDEVNGIFWSLDGNDVASGTAADIVVPLGTHTIAVRLSTVLGKSASDAKQVTVRDRTRPVLSAGFVHKSTGTPVTSIDSGDKARIAISASDVCDPDPAITATVGLPVGDEDLVKAKNHRDNSDIKLSILGNTDSIELKVTAEDNSGNMASDSAVLTIIP